MTIIVILVMYSRMAVVVSNIGWWMMESEGGLSGTKSLRLLVHTIMKRAKCNAQASDKKKGPRRLKIPSGKLVEWGKYVRLHA